MDEYGNISDELVVRHVLAGKREAFAVLVKRYLSPMEALAYSRTRNYSDAEDITQEALLQAFRRLDTLRDPARFGPWLTRIVTNVTKTLLAKRARQEQRVSEPASDTSETNVERRELYALLRSELGKLEEPYRDVLLMYYFAGMSARDIAATLNISRSAVLKRLERGRKAFGLHILEVLGDAFPEQDSTRSSKTTAIMAAVTAMPLPWSPATQAAGTAMGLGNVHHLFSVAFSGGKSSLISFSFLCMVGVAVILYGPMRTKQPSVPDAHGQVIPSVESPGITVTPAATATPAVPDDAAAGPETALDERPAAPVVPPEPTDPAKTRAQRIKLAKTTLLEGWEDLDLMQLKGWTYLALLGDEEGRERLLTVAKDLGNPLAQNANRYLLTYLDEVHAQEYLQGVVQDSGEYIGTRAQALEAMMGGMYVTVHPEIPIALERYYQRQVEASHFTITDLRRFVSLASEDSRIFLEDILYLSAFNGIQNTSVDAYGRTRASASSTRKQKSGTLGDCTALEALRGLEYIGNPASMDLVRLVMEESGVAHLQRNAVQSLHRLGGSDEAEAIIRLRVVQHPELSERMAYAALLERLYGDDTCRGVVYEALNHPEAAIRGQAYSILSRLGDPAFIAYATQDLDLATGAPLAYHAILHGDNRRMMDGYGIAFQGTAYYMSDCCFEYNYRLAAEGRTRKSEELGLAGMLSADAERLQTALPLALAVFRERMMLPQQSGDRLDKTSCHAFMAQLYKLLIIVRVGDTSQRQRAIAFLETMYETLGTQSELVHAQRGILCSTLGWARHPEANDVLEQYLHESEDRKKRVLTAVFMLANEAGVLPE